MPAQFFDQPVGHERLLGGVMKNVEPDKTRKQILVAGHIIGFRCCHSMFYFVIVAGITRAAECEVRSSQS